MPYLPSNFNPSTPAGANRVTQMVMEQVWPQAFVIDPEYQAETTGFIDSAEVVGLSPMTVSYVIDPKATWSDGYPITATDFVYNWQQQLLASPVLASPAFLAGYRDIRSISGSNGGKTVRVVFNRPYSDWEGLFANLIPAHIAERAGWASAFAGFRPQGSDLWRALHRELAEEGQAAGPDAQLQVLGNTGSLAEHRVPGRAVGPGLPGWFERRERLDRRGHTESAG